VWKVAVTLGVTAVIIAFLVREFGEASFFDAVCTAKPAWVAIAFCISCVCVAFGALRWDIVLRAMGYQVGLPRILEVMLATWPPAVVVPSRANELLRAVAVRDIVPVASGTGSVLAEKWVDIVMLLALAETGAALSRMWTWALLAAIALVCQVPTLLFLTKRREWLKALPGLRRRPETVEELFAGVDALARAPWRLGATCAVSLLIRILTVAVTQALLIAVGADVGWFETLTLWPLAMLVAAAPVTLGGMGTRDAAFIYLLRARGTVAVQAHVLAATMGYSAIAVWSFAILGLPLMIREATRTSAR
jgi:uncharacterized membrane protein YbhN (UPF0104 family)